MNTKVAARQPLLAVAAVLALLALAGGRLATAEAAPPMKVLIKVCDGDNDPLMTCTKNCTTYVTTPDTCWNTGNVIENWEGGMTFGCESYPQCFYGSSFASRDCTGMGFNGTTPCNTCNGGTVAQCSKNAVDLQMCTDDLCSENCKTIFTAGVGACSMLPTLNTSLFIAGYKPCTGVNVTTYGGGMNNAPCDGYGSSDLVSSGSCSWSFNTTTASFNLAFSCVPASAGNLAGAVPLSSMPPTQRAVIHSRRQGGAGGSGSAFHRILRRQ